MHNYILEQIGRLNSEAIIDLVEDKKKWKQLGCFKI